MRCKLGTLRIAFGALLIVSALGATEAGAAEFHSTAAASTKISAVQTSLNVFTSTAGEFTCENITFTGTQSTPTTASYELTPQFSGCHMIIFGSTISLSIAHNECKFKLYSSGLFDIVCPAGKAITYSGAGCTITIGPQTGVKQISYTNNASDIAATFSLSGIKYSHAGFTCGTGSGTNGTYKGGITIVGTNTSLAAVTVSYS